MWKLFKTAEENNQTIYFIGSKKNEIESAVTKIAAKYPNLKIVGYNDGYIKNYEKKVLKTILELSPDIVIVGMGAGLQEQFLIKLKGMTPDTITIFTLLSTSPKLNIIPYNGSNTK